jgi:hypothetical protein
LCDLGQLGCDVCNQCGGRQPSACGPTRLLVTETESYPSPKPAPGTATSRIIYADTVALT